MPIAIAGAFLGLAMPRVVEVLLGCTVLGIVSLMLVVKRSETGGRAGLLTHGG